MISAFYSQLRSLGAPPRYMITVMRKAEVIVFAILVLCFLLLPPSLFLSASAQYGYGYAGKCPDDWPTDCRNGYCCDADTTCGTSQTCGVGYCCGLSTHSRSWLPFVIIAGCVGGIAVCGLAFCFFYKKRNGSIPVTGAEAIGTISPFSSPSPRPNLPKAPEPGSPNWICPKGHLNIEPGKKCSRKKCRAANPNYKPASKPSRVNTVTVSQPGLPLDIVPVQSVGPPASAPPPEDVDEAQAPAFVAIAVQS